MGWVVGHARLACVEAGHWMGRWARAGQGDQPGQHKAQGPTDNRTLSLTASLPLPDGPTNKNPFVNAAN